MMGFGLLIPIVLVAAIAYAVGWRPSQLNNLGASPDIRQSPLDILKERYARGEIGQEEYRETRRDLIS